MNENTAYADNDMVASFIESNSFYEQNIPDITTITKEITTFKVARDKPNTLKFTSLQFGGVSFRLFNSSSLFTIPKLSEVQPENSGKILCSIPT